MQHPAHLSGYIEGIRSRDDKSIQTAFHLTLDRRLTRAVCVDQAGQSKTDASQGENVDNNAFAEQSVVRLSGNRHFCRRR
jgi:hypothetical protein